MNLINHHCKGQAARVSTCTASTTSLQHVSSALGLRRALRIDESNVKSRERLASRFGREASSMNTLDGGGTLCCIQSPDSRARDPRLARTVDTNDEQTSKLVSCFMPELTLRQITN